ncbi:MAG: aminotransferase class I/II-fold pyridoxal phosphate-dependent enzyme [Bacteroidota bacterium]|nr:aminotransferase class I/II-fold pyridoxal phosphate-dependent enzyme [Bacteroidota bacterium]
MKTSDILLHYGEDYTQLPNSFSDPIIQSSNFEFSSVSEMHEALQNEKSIPVYSRGNNPTVRLLEHKIAALENAEEALAFASGIAAISAAILNSVHQGSHIVAIRESYSWARAFFDEYLPKFGVSTTLVEGSSIDEIESAITPMTKLIYVESPSSWFFNIQDLKAIAKIAKNKGIRTICDNSFSSPLGQRPTDYGIDLVLHSASKYLGGHSDIVGGILCGSKELIADIFKKEYMNIGAIMAPQTAWLISRGLRTLQIRLNRVSQSRETVQNFLEKHTMIEKVIHPFHSDHPGQDIAKKQMSMGNGLFSVFLKTKDEAQIEKFCNNLKSFSLAVSWGGHESLIFPALVLGVKSENASLPINMVRLYVGLDQPEILIEDLSQALDSAFALS